MTDLPNEIMVWRSMEKLTHIGTWATERYPEEAVAYVPLAYAQAAQAMVVERAAKDARDVFSDDKTAKDAVDYMEQLIYSANRSRAPASGVETLAALRAERDTLRVLCEDRFNEIDRLAAANAVLEAKVAGLRRDALILLAQIDGVEDATGEAPEGEDALLVAEIRAALATQEAGTC